MLTHLPTEMILEIFSFLPYYDTSTWFSIMSSCKTLLFLSRKYLDPAVDKNMPIRRAAKRGKHIAVRYLLSDPRVDPSAETQCALLVAAALGHHLVVRELLKDKRVDPTILNNEGKKNQKYKTHFCSDSTCKYEWTCACCTRITM